MVDVKFVAVDRFISEQQATAASAWLEADGIETFLEGATASATLSYFGVGTVNLMVSQTDEQAALESLDRYRQQVGASPDWYCGSCQETNDGSFDICWKCKGDRNDVATDFPEPQFKQSERHTKPIHQLDSQNPYQPTEQVKIEPADYDSDSYTDHQAQDDIQRAYRSAVLGIAMPIVFLPLSIILLLGSYDSNQPISDSSRKKRLLTWLVILFSIFAWAGFISLTISLLFDW